MSSMSCLTEPEVFVWYELEEVAIKGEANKGIED